MHKFKENLYTSGQLNQILASNEKVLFYLSPNFDIQTFRAFKEYSNIISEDNIKVLINQLNNTNKIFGFDEKTFFNFLQPLNESEKNQYLLYLIELIDYHELENKNLSLKDIEKFYLLSTKDFSTFNDAATELLKIKNDTNKDFSFVFNMLKDKSDIKEIVEMLGKYSDIVEEEHLKNLLKTKKVYLIDYVYSHIKKGEYTPEVLNYTDEESNFKTVNLILQNKLDINYYCSLDKYGKDDLSNYMFFYPENFKNFYNKKYSSKELNILSTLGFDIEKAQKFFNLKADYNFKLDAAYFVKECFASFEDIKYLLDNKDSYTKEDKRILLDYLDFQRTSIGLNYISFKRFIDIKFDASQRQMILDIFKGKNLDITIYCNENYNKDQMKVIAEGILRNRKVKNILDPNISAQDMEKKLFFDSFSPIFNVRDSGNFKEDKNFMYENFLDVYYQIFTGNMEDTFCTLEILDKTFAYNKKHEYQFDAEKNISLSRFFNGNNLGEFDNFLCLGKKAEELYDIVDSDTFFKRLYTLCKENLPEYSDYDDIDAL